MSAGAPSLGGAEDLAQCEVAAMERSLQVRPPSQCGCTDCASAFELWRQQFESSDATLISTNIRCTQWHTVARVNRFLRVLGWFLVKHGEAAALQLSIKWRPWTQHCLGRAPRASPSPRFRASQGASRRNASRSCLAPRSRFGGVHRGVPLAKRVPLKTPAVAPFGGFHRCCPKLCFGGSLEYPPPSILDMRSAFLPTWHTPTAQQKLLPIVWGAIVWL